MNYYILFSTCLLLSHFKNSIWPHQSKSLFTSALNCSRCFFAVNVTETLRACNK